MKKLLPIGAMLTIASSSFGAGYEKLMFSGKAAGLAGAYSSSVQGADALYFNPAGLAGNASDQEVSINVSPTRSQFGGPISRSSETVNSQVGMSLPAGVFYSKKLTDSLGMGFGVSSSAGTEVIYPSVDFAGSNSNLTYRPDIKSELRVIEYALGLGYKFNPNWSFGAAWRISQVDAALSSAAAYSNGTFGYTSIDNIKGTDWKSYRLGIQYLSDDKTFGAGLNYRSQVNIQATGDSTGVVNINGTAAGYRPVQGGKATIVNKLPTQVDFAVHKRLGDASTIFGGITWTHYHSNQDLLIHGSTTALTGASSPSDIPDIHQGWHDSFHYRLAYQHDVSDNLKIRGGYYLATRVTNADAARPTFTAPASSHSFLLGVGTGKIRDVVQFDLAGEYTTISGSGTTPTETSALGTNNAKTGTFYTRALVAHLSAKFFF